MRSRASAKWPAATSAGRFNLEGYSARAARHAADRSDLRHRRQRHPARDAKDKGTGRKTRSPSGARACPVRDPADGQDAGMNAARPGWMPCAGAQPGRRHGATACANRSPSTATKLDATEKGQIKPPSKELEDALKGRRQTRDGQKTKAANVGQPNWARRCTRPDAKAAAHVVDAEFRRCRWMGSATSARRPTTTVSRIAGKTKRKTSIRC